MIPKVSYVPNIWDALSKARTPENKLPQRPKRDTEESYSFKQPAKLSDPLLGRFIDISI